MFKRPCLDCATLTERGNRCAPCETRVEATRTRQRGSQRPYNSRAWRRLSSQIRSRRPWCEMCGSTMDLTVDHLQPLSVGGALVPAPEALRVLCRRCHGKVTSHR